MLSRPSASTIKSSSQGLRGAEHGQLPEGWGIVTIESIASIMRAGGTPRRGNSVYWGGSIPFVKIEDITSSSGFVRTTRESITDSGLADSSAWLVPSNSVMLTMYASIGETAINRLPVATNQAIMAIVPNLERVSPVFLMFALKFRGSELASYNIQTTQKNVNAGIVRRFQIPLSPLPEQRAVAHILRTVQQAKEATEAVIAATRELKKSLMRHLFTYGPVPVDQAEQVPLKETEIGLVPERWGIDLLGNIASIVSGGTPSRNEPSYWNGDIPWVKTVERPLE